MADEKQPAAPLITEIEHSPDFKEIYSNYSRLAMTPYDLVMTLGHIIEKTSGKASISEDVTVRFSPQAFKFLVLNMTAAMTAWEKQFGSVEIRARTAAQVTTALQSSAEQARKEFLGGKEP